MTKQISDLTLPNLNGLSVKDAKTAMLIRGLRNNTRAIRPASSIKGMAPIDTGCSDAEQYMTFLCGEAYHNPRAFSSQAQLKEFLLYCHPWLSPVRAGAIAEALWIGHRLTAAKLMLTFCKQRR